MILYRQTFSVGNHVACVKTYSTFIQLCSNGFHQQRHRGGRACDVGGAGVYHSCAALHTKHHLRPHRNAGTMKVVENKTHVSEWVCAHTHAG